MLGANESIQESELERLICKVKGDLEMNYCIKQPLIHFMSKSNEWIYIIDLGSNDSKPGHSKLIGQVFQMEVWVVEAS